MMFRWWTTGPQFWYGAFLLEDKPMNCISVTCAQMACTFTCSSVLIHWIFTSGIPKVCLGGTVAWMDPKHLNGMFRQVTFVKLLTMCHRNGRHQLSRRAIPNAQVWFYSFLLWWTCGPQKAKSISRTLNSRIHVLSLCQLYSHTIM